MYIQYIYAFNNNWSWKEALNLKKSGEEYIGEFARMLEKEEIL